MLAECGILGFEIRNTVLGIRNLTNDWNRESKFTTDKEFGILCLESRIQDWLGLPSMGRITSFIGYCKIMRGTGSKSGPQTVPWCSSTTQSTVTCSNLTMTSKQAAPVKYESWKVSFATHGVISLLASVAGDFGCVAGKWVAKPWG